MVSPYSASAIANFFIKKNKSEPTDFTHLKIQKLLFFAQGWFMANYNMPLFNESFEAWRHGPVVRSIYNALHGSGDSTIDNEITTTFMTEDGKPYFGTPQVLPEDTAAINFLEKFWKVYAPIHAFQLSTMSHATGSPWHNIYTAYGGCLPFGVVIDDSDIKEYFVSLKEKVRAQA